MSVPLNMLHIQGSFDLGGREARIVQLMNHWGPRARHCMIIGNPGMDSARSAIGADVDVRFPEDAPPISGRPSPSALTAIASYMRSFDLVLTYNWGAMDGAMAHRLFSGAMSLPNLVHHEDGFNADEVDGLKLHRNIYRRMALGSAYALVVPSCQLEHIAISAWGQPPSKVHHIPNGIDVAAYGRSPRPDAIPGLDKDDGRIVVGTVAGLRSVKNLLRLVRIAAPFADRIRLVIVGEGPEREAIAEEARRVGLSSLVLPGFLPRPQEFVGLFDIFALTSDSEQFPIALVEAMAAGLPVIATDVGDVCSMVAPGNRPFILDPRDEGGLKAALGRLISNPALRAELGAANRHRAMEAFDQKGMIARYAELYEAAAGINALTDLS